MRFVKKISGGVYLVSLARVRKSDMVISYECGVYFSTQWFDIEVV
jgi:hypothetical protein